MARKKKAVVWDGQILLVEDGRFWAKLQDRDGGPEEEVEAPMSSVSKVAWPLVTTGAAFTLTVDSRGVKFWFHQYSRWTKKELAAAQKKAKVMCALFKIE